MLTFSMSNGNIKRVREKKGGGDQSCSSFTNDGKFGPSPKLRLLILLLRAIWCIDNLLLKMHNFALFGHERMNFPQRTPIMDVNFICMDFILWISVFFIANEICCNHNRIYGCSWPHIKKSVQIYISVYI